MVISKKTNFFISFVIVFSVLLIGFGYKYNEWYVLNYLNNLQREADLAELKLIEKSNILAQDDEAVNVFIDSLTEEPDVIESNYKKFNSYFYLNKITHEEYYKLLLDNYHKYQKINKRATFLLGSKKEFVNEFLDLTSNYYENEIENNENITISIAFTENLYKLLKDRLIIEYYFSISDDLDDLASNFGQISSAEKYTHTDFKFDQEDAIRSYYTSGSELLDINKNYISSLYLIAKDVAAGNYESARYKHASLTNQAADSNIDTDDAFSENEESKRRLSQEIAAINIKKILLLDDLNKNPIDNYPFVESLKPWEVDALICNLSWYKTSIYEDVFDEIPIVDNLENLIAELNKVPPSTEQLSAIVNYETNKIEYDTENGKLRFICKANTTGEELVFITDLPPAEENE